MAQATKCSGEQDGLVRIPAHLRGSRGSVSVCALLDSGATREYVSSVVYERLLDVGIVVRRCSQSVQMLAGKASATIEVTCDLSMEPQGPVSRVLCIPVDLLVVDGAAEDVIIGMGLMTSLGLTPLLLNESTDTATPAGVGDSDEAFDVEEPDVPCDMPTVNVPGEDGDMIHAVLLQHAAVFGPLPPAGAAVPPMVIELTDGAAPAALPPRRLSPPLQAVVQDTVDEWLDLGIIRPSISPYSSPLVLVRKKDGSYRACVDYRVLNRATVDIRFPLQNTKSVLERMAGYRVFGTLDLRSGFHQMPLAEDSQDYTAFSTPAGLFSFCRVQFGLKNGPAYFQWTMSRVLNGLIGHVCEVYIDDIIIYAHTMEEFCVRLGEVLQRLGDFRLRVKGPKCCFGLGAVEYLGHVVDGVGVSLSESRKQGLRDIQVPKTSKQLKSFLGMASYFRTFVKDFALVAKPLHHLCSDKTVFEWSDAAQQAFDSIKAAMMDAPVLIHVDYSKPLILRTDASTVGVGGVLVQVVDGTEKPVSFVSKAFSPVETRWSTLEQECFAIVYSIESLQHHLRGHPFVIETDHRNLLFLQKAQAPKVIRWRLKLQEYSFEIRHIAGRSNVVADGLSRCLVGEDSSSQTSEETAVDDDVQPLTDTTAAELSPFQRYKRIHNSVVGHRGLHLTLDLLREGGWEWPTMTQDVQDFIRSCPVCQKVRLGQGSMAAALATTTVKEPFEVVAIDTVGPLPADAYGNMFIIAVIDCFSRFIELRPAKAATALDAATVLLDVFGRYGAPRALRSDQGAQFTSSVVGNFLKLLGVDRQLTVPYRPESNGLIERANKEIGRHLRSLVMEQRVMETWSMSLPLVQRILNATPKEDDWHIAGTHPFRRTSVAPGLELDI